MNREQQRIFSLLKEFDEFCRSAGVQYYLSGETLLYAYVCEGMEPRPYCASVLMKSEDCLKFIRALESKTPADRELEYWGTSSKYPDYTVRYVASDSTAFSPYDCLDFKTHGMFIDIQILKGGRRTNKRRKWIALERGIEIRSWSRNGLQPAAKDRTDRMALLMLAVREKLSGKQKLRRDLFSYYAEKCSDPMPQDEGCAVYTFCSRGKKFNRISEEHFVKPAECVIEGAAFPAPCNTEELLKKMFKARFSIEDGTPVITGNEPPYNDSCVIYTDVPYVDIYDKTGVSKADAEELCRCEKAIAGLMAANKENAELAKSDWQVVLETEAEIKKKKQ